MKIGPKFKIAKRLGAPIFEKTQSQKFELSLARGGRKTNKRPGQMSDFKRQLIEKQKMRLSYGLTEKQLRRYVDESIEKSSTPAAALMIRLEARLDNVAYRLGLAKTRRLARQMVSHGHICVNGKKMTIPSYRTKVGDILTVREGSRQTGLFINLAEKHEITAVPGWLSFDAKKLEGEMKTEPVFDQTAAMFDPDQVMEFYSR